MDSRLQLFLHFPPWGGRNFKALVGVALRTAKQPLAPVRLGEFFPVSGKPRRCVIRSVFLPEQFEYSPQKHQNSRRRVSPTSFGWSKLFGWKIASLCLHSWGAESTSGTDSRLVAEFNFFCGKKKTWSRIRYTKRLYRVARPNCSPHPQRVLLGVRSGFAPVPLQQPAAGRPNE